MFLSQLKCIKVPLKKTLIVTLMLTDNSVLLLLFFLYETLVFKDTKHIPITLQIKIIKNEFR